TDHDRVRDCLDSVAAAAPATLPEAQAAALPASLSPAGEALDVAERVRALAGTSPWVDGGIATMNRGCPTSVGIAVQQLQRAGAMSLADTFRMELIVATHCARHRDFAEGVRALIIDKDNRPQWQFGRLEDLPADYVAEHFTAPWPANPLADLEGA
ncbi:MAG: enoyl-CoA hydratase/isomerase family protein, partial [Pseudomonadales bacterium]